MTQFRPPIETAHGVPASGHLFVGSTCGARPRVVARPRDKQVRAAASMLIIVVVTVVATRAAHRLIRDRGPRRALKFERAAPGHASRRHAGVTRAPPSRHLSPPPSL
jgi:hypothetical protein